MELQYCLLLLAELHVFNLTPLCFYLFEQKGRALRCSKGFLEWLQETCPEVTDVMPTNDKKFKGRAVTRFLLDELEEQYVAPLLDVSYLTVFREHSGKVLDSRPRGRGFQPQRHHCVVVLEQDTFILA